ncbi:hypothetical protein [Desertibaculum subflavum]|uniref:hypothetical protein n=1 Tax=Desertibaculum subflavum TaxID=2268458 RepID=UPI000E671BF5
MLRRCLLLLAVWFVAGCAAQTVPPAAKSSIRNVAVISLIGDTVSFEKFGLTIFNNSYKEAVLELGLDRLATEAVQSALRRRNPAISLVALAYDRAALNPVYLQKTVNLAFEDYVDPARIAAPLRQLTAGTAVDTLILITRARLQHALDAPGTHEGPGVMMTSAAVGPPMRVLPYAVLRIYVLDARSLQPIAQHTDVAKETRYYEGSIFNLPPPTPITKEVSVPLAPAEEAFVRAELQRIIPATLDGMVVRIGL